MLQPGAAVGRYVIKRKLAEGGMAEIFLASAVGAEGFSKDVVIKVVRSFLATDDQFVKMFIAEARLASRLNHANVVQIFDFGKHQDSYYLAMEYVRGASLWDLRKRCRELKLSFPPTLAAEIGAQVARGMHYAHSLTEGGQRLGVVHRDVTPHNVLLSFDGAVKLTDFGIAKAQTSQTAPGMLKGKFAYMSPEQSRGESVDQRTDLFALGVVLWELLTGGRLFDGDSDLAVIRAVQESLIPSPSRMNPDVPTELSDVVLRALARPLGERFQTAAEMERALANFVLRTANSVEETSVAAFLQYAFRQELEQPSGEHPAPLGNAADGGDDFGVGSTVSRGAVKTETATPVDPFLAKRMEEEEVTHREEATPVARPRTEQMPALRRPISRKLDPLPVGEPSVIVRPSAKLPDPAAVASISETEVEPVTSEAPRTSRAPFFALAAVALLGMGVAVWYGLEGQKPPPVVAVVVPPAAVERAAEPPPSAAIDVAPLPELKPELDAGAPAVEPVAVVPPPEAARASVAAAPRRQGTLEVHANPFATVTFLGHSYEVTGVRKIPAPTGTYEVVLSHPHKSSTEKVTVQASQTTSITFIAK